MACEWFYDWACVPCGFMYSGAEWEKGNPKGAPHPISMADMSPDVVTTRTVSHTGTYHTATQGVKWASLLTSGFHVKSQNWMHHYGARTEDTDRMNFLPTEFYKDGIKNLDWIQMNNSFIQFTIYLIMIKKTFGQLAGAKYQTVIGTG